MASTVVTIKIVGDESGYTASAERVIQQNRRLNRDAIESAKSINLHFQSMMGSLSQIAGLVGVGFSATALLAFGRSVITTAGQIDDLAKRTGFSRQTLSAFKSTIEENGGSLEGFANAVNKVQKSLGDIEGDGKKAADTLRAMGVNVTELIKATPDAAFEKIAKALAGVTDQNERVTIATRLFSRAGAEQIPVVLELAAKYDELKASGQGMSEETIKRLDAIGDAFTRFKNQLITAIGEAIAAQGDFTTAIDDAGKKMAEWTKYIIENKEAILLLAAGVAVLTGHWYAAAAAGAAFIATLGGASKTEKELANIEQERLTLNQQLQTAATLREKGVRTGIASDITYQEMLKKGNELLTRRQGLTDQGVSERMTHEPVPTNKPALDLNFDSNLVDKQQQALERLRSQLAQLKLTIAEAARSQGDFSVDVRSVAVALIEQERQAALTAAAHDKTLTPAVRGLIEQMAALKIAQFDATEADKARARYVEAAKAALEAEAEDVKTTAEAWAFYAQSLDRARQSSLNLADIEKQITDLQADELRANGRTMEADRLRLTAQIDYLEKIRDLETDVNKKRLYDQQILNTQAQIQRLGEVTINVGQTISKALGDAFQGVVLGTSKLADVGKNLLTAIGRDVATFFTESITKKLGFENLIFSNLRGLPAQANAAIANGMNGQDNGILQMLFGGGSGGGGSGGGMDSLKTVMNLASSSGGSFGGIGDLLKVLFTSSGGSPGGFGSAPAGVEGPLMANGGFFSGGGGGGLGSIISSVGSGVSKFMPAGTSLGGALGGAFTGFGIGSMINGKTGGIAGAIGGAGGSLIGSSTAIGTALGLGGSIASSLTSMLAPLLGALMAGIMTSFIIPGIGAIIAALISLINRPPAPAAWVKSSIDFYYDEMTDTFNQMNNTTLGKVQGAMKKSQLIDLLTKHGAIIDKEADRFVSILNEFPASVHYAMKETLDAANEHINRVLGSRKYSPGGKNDIAQELENLKLTDAPLSFWHALRETIGVGIQETFKMAEVQVSNLTQAFPELAGGSKDLAALELPVGDAEKTQKFIDGLKKLINFSTGLATFGRKSGISNVSAGDLYLQQNPGVAADAYYGSHPWEHYLSSGKAEGLKWPTTGITSAADLYLQQNPGVAADPYYGTHAWEHYLSSGKSEGLKWPTTPMGGINAFLPEQDMATIQAELERVFATPGEEFAAAVDKMIEDIKPIQDALTEMVKTASDIFGRGLIAAMEAATESDAKLAFFNTLNTGIKDEIFNGITEAFIASAQFTDLLAPIQKTIREFTQNALATGEIPSVEEFRKAILPGIETITTRAELLTPLIAELQNLGFSIKELLGLNKTEDLAPTDANATPTVQNITLYINANKEDMDPRTLAREIGDAIGGLLPPPQ